LLAVPSDTPVGIGAVRVCTSNGVSSLQPFMVDDLPCVVSIGTNKNVASAQRIVLPTAVDGSCIEEGFNYFKFTASAGQKLSVEVVAQRLGSPLDPVIRLLDSKGRELAYSDDEPALGADSRFSHKFAAKGEYVLEIRDIRYQGGSSYRYHLRIGDFPLINTPFPIAVLHGAKAQFSFTGPSAEQLKPITLNVPDDAVSIPLSTKGAKGHSSGFAVALATDGPEFVEREPNDMPEFATKVTV